MVQQKKIRNSLINIDLATRLSKNGTIPLWPYIVDILKGGIATLTFLLVTYGLDRIALLLGYSGTDIIKIAYYLSFAPLILYFISSTLVLLIDCLKSIKNKWKE